MTTKPSTIADALERTPVYVHPQSAAAVPTGVQEQLAQAIADSPVPVFVVAQELQYDDMYGGSPGQLLALVHDELGRDGVYAHVGADGSIDTRGYGYGDEWEAAAVAAEAPSPAAAAERFVQLVATGTGRQAYDELNAEPVPEPDGGAQGDGADAGEQDDTSTGTSTTQPPADESSPLVTVGTVAGVLVVIAAIVAIMHRARRARAARRQAGTFTVPDHVVAAVHDARTAEVEEQARTTVLALGEAIDRTASPAGGDSLTEYQHALDAYDAAGRTLDRSAGLADTVGALVLAEMGQVHLTRATGSASSRRAPLPRTCYFNPLHGGSTTEAPLPGHAETRVPTCAACAGRIKRGEEPAALTIDNGGALVPYYESGAQPWASTGYGALSRDLVQHVLAGH